MALNAIPNFPFCTTHVAVRTNALLLTGLDWSTPSIMLTTDSLS